MRRTSALLTALALALAGAAGTGAPARAETGIGCGARISTDTVLDADLLDCPGTGLVIDADNITLDLNGHTVDGDAAEVADCAAGPGRCDVGIANTAGHAGVRITGGSITDFSLGVSLVGAAENSLSRLTVSRNLLAGVELDEVTGGRVEHSAITRNAQAPAGVGGITLVSSTDVVIEGNDIDQNGKLGIRAATSSVRHSIAGNRVTDNAESGILLNGDENTVTRNVFLRNGGGIAFGGNRNRVVGNVVADVPWCGYPGCGSAIQLVTGRDNRISANLVHGAPAGIDLESFEGSLEGTVVSGNTVDKARGTGIAVDVSHGDGTLENTLLEHNVVTRGADDGFSIENASTTLTGNVALGNAGLGIEAVTGVTDGGDNYAAANGDSRQCTEVDCG
jgi:parallel beta-helix repeat protein